MLYTATGLILTGPRPSIAYNMLRTSSHDSPALYTTKIIYGIIPPAANSGQRGRVLYKLDNRVVEIYTFFSFRFSVFFLFGYFFHNEFWGFHWA